MYKAKPKIYETRKCSCGVEFTCLTTSQQKHCSRKCCDYKRRKRSKTVLNPICGYCGEPFETINDKKKYCCPEHQRKAEKDRVRERKGIKKLEPKNNNNEITYTTLVMIVTSHEKGESMKSLAMETGRDEKLLLAVLAKMMQTGKYRKVLETITDYHRNPICGHSSLRARCHTVYTPTDARLSL